MKSWVVNWRPISILESWPCIYHTWAVLNGVTTYCVSDFRVRSELTGPNSETREQPEGGGGSRP